MSITLDKQHEFSAVPVYSGGQPGVVYVDYDLDVGASWTIERFGASSNVDGIKVELLFSEDGGSTFTNPYDLTTNKIRILDVVQGPPSETIMNNVYFLANGSHLIRINVNNYNTANTADVSIWFNGSINGV